MKTFSTSEMGIDVNDIKKLINSGFRYLIKTCHQWAKDHPLLACVLTFLCILYIFFLPLFSVLFYILPFLVCGAILVGGSRVKSDEQKRDIRHSKKEDDQTGVSNVKKMVTATSYSKRRSYLQPQMSRRTLGKDKNFIEDVGVKENQPREVNSDNEDDFESFIKKYGAIEPESPTISAEESTAVFSVDDSPDKNASKSMQNKLSNSCFDIESRDEYEHDEQQQKEETNKVVQWTENDEKNQMDLGSSEIDRNKRLESLMAKRRAKKLLSMQPRRNHIDYLEEFSAFDHQHLDSVGSLMVAKANNNAEQPPISSAPFSWLPKRNPFDIPYELLEERPVLTGGSFEEDVFARVFEPKEFLSGADEGFDGGETNPFGELKKDFLPSFFTKVKSSDELRSSRHEWDSDDDETVKDNEGKTTLEGKEKVSASSDLLDDSRRTTNVATEMEERSHPTRLDDSGTKLEMPDVIEESNNNRMSEIETVHNASNNSPNASRTKEEVEQAPNRGVLNMAEDKELEASKESSDQNSSTSQPEAPKEGKFTSNEQHELKKERDEHVPSIIEYIHHSEQVESTPLEKGKVFDSYSTHSEEDNAPKLSRSDEASGESEKGITLRNQVEGEVKVEVPKTSVIHVSN